MSLEKTINDAIKEAMKAKKQDDLRALRAIKSAVMLAKTAEGAKESLSEEEETKLLTKLAKQRKDSIKIFENQDRGDLAAIEKVELEVISRFLPEPMSEEDVEKIILGVIKKTGASSMQDMGKVMGMSMKELAGKADGGLISNIVKKALS